MQIVFWSPVPGQGCVTSSLLAVATYLASSEKKKVSILSTNCTNHDMQLPFIGYEQEKVFVDAASRLGLDALFRSAKGERLTKEIIEDAALRLSPRLAIFAMPSSGKVSVNETTLLETHDDIVTAVDKYNDFTLIDTRGGATRLNQKVLSMADVIVVCLNQNRSVFEAYFEQFKFSGKKLFYLVGNYDRNQSFSMKNIRRRYKSLKSNNSAVIWHNSDFSDAMNEGKLFKWMNVNKGCKKTDVNYPFIHEVDLATKKLIKMAGRSDT